MQQPKTITMNLPQLVASHFRDVYFGNNWTDVNLKDSLAGVDWTWPQHRSIPHNSIATLIFHMNYYVSRVLPVLRGQQLDAHDKNTFDHPPIKDQQEWENLQTQVLPMPKLLPVK